MDAKIRLLLIQERQAGRKTLGDVWEAFRQNEDEAERELTRDATWINDELQHLLRTQGADADVARLLQEDPQ